MRQSPFLRLPAELRNEIYRMVIGGHIISISRSKQGHIRFYTTPNPTGLTFQSKLHVTYLSEVCRQTRQDTAGLHCALNTFIAKPRELNTFINTNKTAARHLRSVHLAGDLEPTRREYYLGWWRRSGFSIALLQVLRELQQCPSLEKILLMTTHDEDVDQAKKLCGRDGSVEIAASWA